MRTVLQLPDRRDLVDSPADDRRLSKGEAPPLLRPRVTLAEPAPSPLRREASVAPAPTIHVSIGRIEVRATPAAKGPVRETAAARPAVDLETYLRQRSKGEGR
jgi:hypothetical protein